MKIERITSESVECLLWTVDPDLFTEENYAVFTAMEEEEED